MIHLGLFKNQISVFALFSRFLDNQSMYLTLLVAPPLSPVPGSECSFYVYGLEFVNEGYLACQ